MPRYKIVFRRSAVKELAKIARPEQLKIAKAIADLAQQPRPPQSAKLSGVQVRRLRIGHYRVIYTIDDAVLAVEVIRISHRKDVYRRK